MKDIKSMTKAELIEEVRRLTNAPSPLPSISLKAEAAETWNTRQSNH